MTDVQTTQTSKRWSLDTADFVKGLAVAVASAVLTVVENSLENGDFTFNWKNIWHVALLAGVGYLMKNFVTPSKTIVKVLVPILVAMFSLFSPGRATAQTVFTAPVPKLAANAPDSFLCAWRPTAAAAYSIPGNLLMAGAGAGYKRLQWDYETQKWKSVYSINLIAWGAGTTAPGPQVPAFAFGPALGLFNDLIILGAARDFSNGRYFGVLSIGVSLNN